jgi:hypothetical protein
MMDLNDHQLSYLHAPRVGGYFSFSAPTFEIVLRIIDKFISPTSGKIILHVKQIGWILQPGYLDGPDNETFYMEMDTFIMGEWKDASPKQIQKFEEEEVRELGQPDRWRNE